MSISSELRASARATYRSLLRTAASTFKGDDRVLNAFKDKVRNEFRQGRSITDPSAYSARIQLGQEVAEVLRKNIVQAVKVKSSESGVPSSEPTVKDDRGVWRLRFTEHTELGSNDSVKKNPSPCSSSRSKRGPGTCQAAPYSTSASSSKHVEAVDPSDSSVSVSEGEASQLAGNESFSSSEQTGSLENTPQRKLNYSALKRAHRKREVPVLEENDIEESFVRGSGPGGQSINKTQNNVQLLHRPTGIRVSCQETRSLEQNRVIARKILLDKLDEIANPGLSKEEMKRAKQVERERRRRKKARKKAKAKHEDEDD